LRFIVRDLSLQFIEKEFPGKALKIPRLVHGGAQRVIYPNSLSSRRSSSSASATSIDGSGPPRFRTA
jgi:hypothetical protein